MNGSSTMKASGPSGTPITLAINILRVSNDCVTRQSVVIDQSRSMRESQLSDGNWPEDILFEHSNSVSTPRDEAADEVGGWGGMVGVVWWLLMMMISIQQ